MKPECEGKAISGCNSMYLGGIYTTVPELMAYVPTVSGTFPSMDWALCIF